MSDALSPLAQDIEIYGQKHGGHFCEPARVAEMLYRPEDTNYLYCMSSKQPFIWNPDLSRIPLDSATKRVLAWCPPGAHGLYVGVITVLQRKVECDLTTVGELAKMTNSMSHETLLGYVRAQPWPALDCSMTRRLHSEHHSLAASEAERSIESA